jgi:hypothetical protein
MVPLFLALSLSPDLRSKPTVEFDRKHIGSFADVEDWRVSMIAMRLHQQEMCHVK